MTDAEWLACDDPQPMLKVLTYRQLFGDSPSSLKVPTRKLQLLWTATARRVLHLVPDPKAARCLDVKDQRADGLATVGQVVRACRALRPVPGEPPAAANARDDIQTRGDDPYLPLYSESVTTAYAARPDLTGYQDFLRLDPAVAAELRRPERTAQADLVRCVFGNPYLPFVPDPAWLTPTAVALAAGIYADRAFDRLPILADAIEEAECDDPDVLAHCRGPGPHARGCWVVDGLLGKD